MSIFSNTYGVKYMRVYAISDVHTDYQENRRWIDELSRVNYKQDILILAGDVTDDLNLLKKTFLALKSRFYQVHYIPGNHELWVNRCKGIDSLEKLKLVQELAEECHICMEPYNYGELSIVPLYAWYDYSFGKPTRNILTMWTDLYACQWPAGFCERHITRHFIGMNIDNIKIRNKFIISFSHFLPRIDVMPFFIPPKKRDVYPLLGTALLEEQIRSLGSIIHIFGHSHVNTRTTLDNVVYINNALGYPHEKGISNRELNHIF